MGRRGVTLLQAFRGVWVRTQSDVISTAAATLLDFSGDDGPDLGFAYVLPVSSRFALVMAVRMAEEAHVPDPVPAVSRVVGGADWSVEAEEQGVTALVTPSPRRRLGPRVLAIGRRGGRVRPSTGYAVTRVLSDSVAIRRSLDRYGHPFALPRDPHWQGVLDAIWLKALRRERAALEPAFVSLFTRAPVGSVLRFLDGHASLSDVRSVVRALPPAPFVRAALTRG
jgi:lycopene beta-cyclase